MREVAGRIERLLSVEDWRGARRLLRAALAVSPDNHWLWSRLALTYHEQRRYAQALVHEARARTLAPRCPLVLWGLAGTWQMLGRDAEASALYGRLIRRGVRDIATGPCGEGVRWARGLVADCWFRLGLIREAAGRRDLAARAYRRHLAMRGRAASIYGVRTVRRRLADLAREARGAGERANQYHVRRVRCVDDRPFLHERGGRLVVESRGSGRTDLTRGRVYRVLGVERGWYRIVDDGGEDYLYPPHLFEVVPWPRRVAPA